MRENDSVYAIILGVSERIVVDTSVFVGALIGPTGPSRALVRLCLERRVQPLMGNPLFLEYESVLHRDRIQELCPLSSDEVQQLLQAFLACSEWVATYYTWRPNLRDEGDNHLIELAVAGNASFLVTQNVRDFQRAELLFPSFSAIRPEEFIRRYD